MADHRCPLHLAMDGLEKEGYSLEKSKFLQRLIELSPLALFKDIAEEVHNFLPVSVEEIAPPFYEDDEGYWKEEESIEGIDSTQEGAPQRIFSIAMADGVYQLVIDRSCWSPYDKLKAATTIFPEVSIYIAIIL